MLAKRYKQAIFYALAMVMIAVIAIMASCTKEPAIKATWIWDGTLISAEKDDILAFAKQNGVNLIYLHIEQAEVTHQEYRSFIREARASGIRVDALGGDPAWSLVSNRDSITRFVEWVKTYNQSVSQEERFTGIHVDIEPHVLPEWKKRREKIKNQWVKNMEYLIRESRKEVALQVSADIPFWMNEYQHADKSESVSKWLVSHLDHVTLMAYRDEVEGPNGVLEIVTPILNEAHAYERKVVVGLNVLKSREGENTTFHEEGLEDLEQQLEILEESLDHFPAYGGYAIHDYERWRRLRID